MNRLDLKYIPNVPFKRTFAQEMQEQELLADRRQQAEPVEPFMRTIMTAKMMLLSHYIDTMSLTKSKCICITNIIISTMKERCTKEGFVEWADRVANGSSLTRTIERHLKRRYGSTEVDESFVRRVNERIDETNYRLSFKELYSIVL